MLALIERKAQGEEIAVQPAAEEVAAPAPDLMSALKASLDAVRAREDEADGQAAQEGAGKKGRRQETRRCEEDRRCTNSRQEIRALARIRKALRARLASRGRGCMRSLLEDRV